MRTLLLFRRFLIPFSLIFIGINIVLVSGQCLNHQRLNLLQLRNNLKFNSSLSTRLVSWNHNTDCCSWKGVNCNTAGQVIDLDLNNESISGGIHNSSSLFSLQFLQSLNLANNKFNFTEIPSGLGNLISLTYLNLSYSEFAGQIPKELSHMTRLVILDLSSFFSYGDPLLKLENPNLALLVQNLTKLTELYLDCVNISSQRYDWCQVISSSLPNLRVMSLSNCRLSGPIDDSLSKLRSLSFIHLSQNDLSAPVPQFIANFTNLTVLRLSSCNLIGAFPQEIVQVPTLQILDLSNNKLLHGSWPEFHTNGSLQTFVLSYTNFSGEISDSIGNLRMLSRLELHESNLTGPIPHSVANLTQLCYLDLSSNNFTGQISSFDKIKNLTHIDISRNCLSGSIPLNHFEGLPNLVYVDLRFNAFDGSIPLSLFSLPLVQIIRISNNNFDGLLPNFHNTSTSLLNTLDLSSNNLEGSIPMSFFDLRSLSILELSSNKFNGTIPLEALQRLGNLTMLDLSYNDLSIETSHSNSTLSLFPQLTTLNLASCNLQNFPNLRNQSRLVEVDLSDNQIGGEVPNWIWEVSYGNLVHLNLSCNLLTNLQQPYDIPPYLIILDLHSNQLQGRIPTVPPFATYVDYSANYFSSSIPVDLGNNLTFAYFFSASNNNLVGTIPESLCNATYLQVLDLSNNNLSGKIPSCLIQSSWDLSVLNLGKNNLNGNISGTFPRNCSLKTLDLHENLLEGMIPESLANCGNLEILDLGDNQIKDTFPCFLKNNSNLHILVLRSNMFHGRIQCQMANGSWPVLQIIDLAANNFSGVLPPQLFTNLGAMMDDKDESKPEPYSLRVEFLPLNEFCYQDKVTVIKNGLQMELVKILTIFTSIDLSSNMFQGEIPEDLGRLTSLYILNVSHNSLTGQIPSSLGNLKGLESLDLSQNKLNGIIPSQLGGLTFLSVLNLSFNQLRGIIPKGSQLQTFSEASFRGNKGLCGAPLNVTCMDAEPGISSRTSENGHTDSASGVNWCLIGAEIGFVVGLGSVIGPLVFCPKWRHIYYGHVDQVLAWIFRLHQKERGSRRRRGRRATSIQRRGT